MSRLGVAGLHLFSLQFDHLAVPAIDLAGQVHLLRILGAKKMLSAILVLVTIVAVTGLYLFWRKSKTHAAELAAKNDTRFHAVSIRPGMSACDNAHKVNGSRILSAEAPILPLPGCDRDQCTCHFVHHRDRRSGDDRRLPFQTGITIAGTAKEFERRLRGDRRRYADDDRPLFT